jgi:hypothetical protein
MERSGDLVFIAAREDGVQVVDVSDRDAPYLRATLHAVDVVDGIEAQGTMAYVADGPRLGIYSFADPDAPILVNTVELPFDVAELEFDRGLIYACGWNADLLIIDVTPPSTPAVVGTVELQRGPGAVLAHEGLLYVADTDLGIHVLDATDPAVPVYLGTCDTPGSVEGLAATDEVVCLAMTRAYGPDAYLMGGLITAPLQCAVALPAPDLVPSPAAAIRLAVQPNPFNPRTTVEFTLTRPGYVSVGVHDLAGRRLAVLAEGDHAAGTHRVRWDGRDARGRSLPSGTYLVKATTGDEASAEKVTLVK